MRQQQMVQFAGHYGAKIMDLLSIGLHPLAVRTGHDVNRRRRKRNLSSITSDRINLDKCKENVIFFLAGELGLLLLNILCYGDMYWMIPEQVLMVPCFKIMKERKKKKEQQLYQKGFQDLLQSLLTSLPAVYNGCVKDNLACFSCAFAAFRRAIFVPR